MTPPGVPRHSEDNNMPSSILHITGLTSAIKGDDLLTCTIPHTVKVTGWSRSEVYRKLAAGHLRAVKSGSRTLILWTSILEHLQSLPAATFQSSDR